MYVVISPTARPSLATSKVTWHLTMKLCTAKILWAGNTAKSTFSEGNRTNPPMSTDWLHILMSLMCYMTYITLQLVLWEPRSNLMMFSSNLINFLLLSLGKHWDSGETNEISCFPWETLEILVNRTQRYWQTVSLLLYKLNASYSAPAVPQQADHFFLPIAFCVSPSPLSSFETFLWKTRIILEMNFSF